MQELVAPPNARVQVAALAAFPLMMIFLALGFIVAFWFLRRRSRIQASGVAPRPGIATEFTWLAAPLVVVVTFAGISANEFSGSRVIGKDGTTVRQSMPLTPRRPQVVPLQVGKRIGSDGPGLPSHRPTWIEQPRSADGDCQHIVISSQQYSTREEAESELSAVASELIRDDLQGIRPGTSHSSWRPPAAEIQRIAVKQQYVEAVDRDFGSFVHPMYRVWWQVELSPEVRTEFLPAWRQGLTNSRVRSLGLVVSTLVLLASLLAMYRRLDVMTEGTHRNVLGFGVGIVSLAWLTVVRIAFNHWL